MPFHLSILSDEISDDLECALDVAGGWGLRVVELRTVWGKSVVDLTPSEVERVRVALTSRGFSVDCVASPAFKSPLRDEAAACQTPVCRVAPNDAADQLAVLARALAVAGALGAPAVRVFSFSRQPWSESVCDQVAFHLRRAAALAASHGCALAVENEQSCNAATGAELGRLLAAVDQPNCRALWDPGNARVAGEEPYPAGYQEVAPRVAVVHVKDCVRRPPAGGEPWRLLGEGEVDWPGQLAALAAAGYDGPLTLEPHPIPPYTRQEAAFRCLQRLRRMLRRIAAEGGLDG